MGKRGGVQKKGDRSRKKREEYVEDQYDDEIDAFHKQRDFVPLDVDKDTDETDEDDELPVFDIKDEDEDGEEDDDDTDDEDAESGGLAAKIIRQKKYLRAKFGDVDDEMADDDKDKDDEDKRITWGGKKGQYHGGDNADFEIQSSDDEALVLEEAEGIRLQKEALASYTAADMGLEDDDSEQESDRELTLEEMNLKGKHASESIRDMDPKVDAYTSFEEVKKDINALTKEEQMDVVYSSAPELVGLLSELNDAVEQLEDKIDPVMRKLKEGEITLNGGIKYLEVKQLLLLAYCQAITFYLLLKSEGQPVRDHPVIARLVEIKALLDKIKELDGNLPPDFEEILKKDIATGTVGKVMKETAPVASGCPEAGHVLSSASAVVVRDTQDAAKLEKVDALTEIKKKKREKRKLQTAQVDFQSEEMLRLRAALEQKLKNKGALGSAISKPDKAQKRLKLANGKLETFDDYVDDDTDNNKDDSRGLTSNIVSQLVSAKRKSKVVSGDDDLPKRDDIGERRRKFEMRVLAGAGVKSEDGDGDGYEPMADISEDDDANDDDMVDNDDDDGSESSGDDLYEQAKRRRDAKLAAKAEMYARPTSTNPSSLPETADGKRLISYQIEKNKGLTRKRNKDLKNPRKKYRKKHEQKVKRRKGQVREMRKPSEPYGGEATGINARVSRSVRF
ncbi:PREDICTED: something about silencing protein 10 [Tarenaya hassleriana]|uniref:something about silencing protein 10 n=1 Tax=Tarenaya hassleriana TaxID=28532 RepID=UPI00053C786E|nr:PREDICTED: something about silencing protein 10 [Tarenaya hassleriana]